jgi:hypothetical protein
MFYAAWLLAGSRWTLDRRLKGIRVIPNADRIVARNTSRGGKRAWPFRSRIPLRSEQAATVTRIIVVAKWAHHGRRYHDGGCYDRGCYVPVRHAVADASAVRTTVKTKPTKVPHLNDIRGHPLGRIRGRKGLRIEREYRGHQTANQNQSWFCHCCISSHDALGD